MNCTVVNKHIDAYVDGELEASAVVEFERHLDECAPCGQRLTVTRLVKQAARRVLSRPSAPVDLEDRIVRRLDEDAGRWRVASRLAVYARGMGTVLAAAAAALLIVYGPSWFGAQREAAELQQRAGASEMDAASILHDVVRRHTQPLPSEIEPSGEEPVEPWFSDKVPFRVRPVHFGEPGARFVGARLTHVRHEEAATLYYRVNGRRVTAVVFRTPADLRRRLAARRAKVGGRELYYQHVQGFTVPIIERGGVTYAFTGDLDDERLLQLVARARLAR